MIDSDRHQYQLGETNVIAFATTKKVVFGLVGFGIMTGVVLPLSAGALFVLALDFAVVRPTRMKNTA